MNLAAALVRAWTFVYTWGLPAGERQARRDEIASDLWDCRHGDPAARSTALTMLGRLLRGVPDDLSWRWECAPTQSLVFACGAAILGTAAIAILALIVWAGSAQMMPRPMPLEGWTRFDRPPGPPPPPPPPPCPPSAGAQAGCAPAVVVEPLAAQSR